MVLFILVTILLLLLLIIQTHIHTCYINMYLIFFLRNCEYVVYLKHWIIENWIDIRTDDISNKKWNSM